MSDLDTQNGTAQRWWLMPVIIGLVITGAVLLLGDFRPVVERFYSVF